MYNNSNTKRSWVEIHLDQLLENYHRYKQKLRQNQEIMIVVKADAYGHGDISISKVLQDNEVRLFAVSNIEEAIHLRENGIGGEILVLGYTPIEYAGKLFEYNITQTLLDENYSFKLSQQGYKIKCQFAIDTGMNRIGLNANKPDECEKVIREFCKTLKINGLFTHLCVADTDNLEDVRFTEEQINKFQLIAQKVSDLNLPYIHCLNSAGGLYHNTKEQVGHIVRLGIVLYGLKPNFLNILPQAIQPVLEWKSVVSMVKVVFPNETIGYGRTFKVKSPMKIATIPTGYADGYRRDLSNKGYILIHGRKAPIIGSICMDQMMVDVTSIDNVLMGDEVVLIGKSGSASLSADELANRIGTIGYELVCGISKRVPRIYIN